MTTIADAVAAGPAPGAPAPREAVYRPRQPVDLIRTVGSLMRGSKDPAMVLHGSVLWRASRTPQGPATLALRSQAGAIHATAWGPGAQWSLDQLPRLCGSADDPSGFDVSGHPVLSELARRFRAVRLTRSDLVFDALVGSVLEQKVTSFQAFGAWRTLLTRFGARAPGPTPRPLYAPPTIDEWRRIPSWAWHRAGVEPPQSRTIVAAAARGHRLSEVVAGAGDGGERERILTSVAGVGAWTSAETRIRALGDPDAVSVGDYHLAHQVGFALTGQRTDDDGMLELLAPWTGHRQRVIRLILAGGRREERRGPRLAPEDHRNR